MKLYVLISTLMGVGMGVYQGENCWEHCFQVAGTAQDRYQAVYNEFYQMGMEARRLKNYYSVNATVFLFDSSLDDFHDPLVNPELLDPAQLAEEIIHFQKRLASITHYMLGNENSQNPASLIQFDHTSAWTCNDHHCLDTCSFDNILYNKLTDPVLNTKSHFSGNVEAACELSYHLLRAYTPDNGYLRGNPIWNCSASARNEMAIVFANSDMHSKVRSSHKGSPCREHFVARLGVGTHVADREDLDEFDSDEVRSIYIKDNPYTYEAADELYKCMRKSCCNSTPSSPATTCECLKSTDKYGLYFNNFNSHDHYGECSTGP